MAELEARIEQWRREQAETLGGSAEVLQELEDHLREEVQQRTQAGQSVDQAFTAAVARLGSPQELATEFARVALPSPWLPVRLVLAALFVLAGWLIGILFTSNRLGNELGLLLVTHITTITLGYAMTILIGVLVACYVLSRPFGGPSPRQIQGLARAVHRLTIAALFMTAVGVVLGGFWAQQRVGRFWGWDIKEIGGALVLSWDAVMVVVLSRRIVANWERVHHTLSPLLLADREAYGFAVAGLHGALSQVEEIKTGSPVPQASAEPIGGIDLNSTLLSILEAIRDVGPATGKKVAAKCGQPHDAVRHHLGPHDPLRSHGLVAHSSSRGYWLTDMGAQILKAKRPWKDHA
jgi:Cytochrome C assembly protein